MYINVVRRDVYVMIYYRDFFVFVCVCKVKYIMYIVYLFDVF